jgi:hypothetical protein
VLPKGLLHLQDQELEAQEKVPEEEEECKGGGGKRKYSRSTSFHSIQECLEMQEGEAPQEGEGGRVELRESLGGIYYTYSVEMP